jgi:Protein of unknown function (DUF3489)
MEPYMSKKAAAAAVAATKTAIRTKESKPKVTKLGRLEAMLRRPAGATIEQLSKALDWQMHSVRGAIAGSLKKKGIKVTSEQPENGKRVYRIA